MVCVAAAGGRSRAGGRTRGLQITAQAADNKTENELMLEDPDTTEAEVKRIKITLQKAKWYAKCKAAKRAAGHC